MTTLAKAAKSSETQDSSAFRTKDADLSSLKLPTPSVERLPNDLETFREKIITTLLPRWCEPNLDAVELFLRAESTGDVKCKLYSAADLHRLDNRDRLQWVEPCLYTRTLDSIRLPIDTGRSFHGREEGPVIFVRNPERGDAVIVLNGNHRTGAVMQEEWNPEGHPLYVLEFSSPEILKKLTGYTLTSRLYVETYIEPGYRPRTPIR